CFTSAVPLLSSAFLAAISLAFLAAISSAFLAAISSAFLAAISSASWQQSHQLHLAAALVTEGRFHTWMSSDSQLTRPLIHHAPKHGFSLSFLFSPTLCSKTPPLH
ncbi:unnamed protein product, partial [Staurois parvus]